MAGGAAGRAERLMCLLFLIKAQGRRGITRAELREHLGDYAKCTNDDAFERMLERDKADLRDMGVVLDVVQRDAYHEDQQAYVLGKGTHLNLPMHFDADELAVLSLAAEAWDRGTWSALAHGALRKLEVFTDVYPIEPTARISLNTDLFVEPIRAAIRGRQAISFAYRRPGDVDAAERQVEPWGLLYRQGGWYCVGFDLDRRAPRVFRTSRISGVVVMAGEATQPVDADWPSIVRNDAVAAAPTAATLLVLPNHGWTWRDAGQVVGQRECAGETYDVIDTALTERPDLVAALAGASPEVLVLEPAELRAQVIAHLDGVLHG